MKVVGRTKHHSYSTLYFGVSYQCVAHYQYNTA